MMDYTFFDKSGALLIIEDDYYFYRIDQSNDNTDKLYVLRHYEKRWGKFNDITSHLLEVRYIDKGELTILSLLHNNN